jgi:hypothetical protein
MTFKINYFCFLMLAITYAIYLGHFPLIDFLCVMSKKVPNLGKSPILPCHLLHINQPVLMAYIELFKTLYMTTTYM